MIETSFLYHSFGVRDVVNTRCEYKGNKTIIHVRSTRPLCCCPHCHSYTLLKNGTRTRQIQTLPIGSRRCYLKLTNQRYKCTSCHWDGWQKIPGILKGKSYTYRFAQHVIDLLRMGTIKAVANHLGVGWDLIKSIHKDYLNKRYKSPKLKGLKRICIDEFAVRKGHIYETIVVDHDTGRIVYSHPGKDKEALTPFWEMLKRRKITLEAVSCDLSPAYISAVMEYQPKAQIVLDHFHIMKLMNEKINALRRDLYREETDLNKRKVIKGVRYLLLSNGADVMDSYHRTRLENVLAMNKPLAIAYYLKEDLRLFWQQTSKEKAESFLKKWLEQADDSGVRHVKQIAKTIRLYQWGILNWYDHPISNGVIEGINNKIKVLKRVAYGYRDMDYFQLRLFALHDQVITQNLG